MDTKKIVNMVQLLTSALVAGVFLHSINYLSGMFNLESKIPQHEIVFSVGTVCILIGVFLFLNKHERTHKFITEVVDEFTRVTWPSKIEVRGATIVVTIFILICGLVWGGVDSIINRVIAAIVGI